MPPAGGSKLRALLVGINYTGTRARLRGCHNDVTKVQVRVACTV
jgi:hypothetical protein